jgi:hypothetical protein
MNLVTVANEKYIPHTISLIESYNKQNFKENIFLYTFETKHDTLNKILETYQNVEIIEIPRINDYIFNTQIFLFKAYAIYDICKKNKAFMYSDSANLFIKDALPVVKFVEKNDRLLLKYPQDLKKNKYFTTSRCFKELGCNEEHIKEDKQYWAGLQAYMPTEKNKNLLKEVYEKMLIPSVAFPESKRERPEGINKDCWFHRNDQSVLSILVEKNKLTQNFDYDIFNMCGDFPTVFDHDLKFKENFDYDKILIYPRYSNFYGPKLPDKLKKVFT